MNVNEFVTIIMPVHNGEAFVAEAIRSIVEQSYSKWKLIIVEDGSTDQTFEIISRFIDERIVVLRNCQAAGVSAARNRGLEYVSTKYIAFLDGDDVWLPNKLSTQVAVARRLADIDLIISSASYVIDSLGEIKGVRSHHKAKSYRELYARNPIILSSAFISQREPGHIKWVFPDCKHEDLIFWVTLLKSGYTHYFLDEKLLKYRAHASSMTSNKFKSLLWHYKALRFMKLNTTQSIYFVLKNLFSKLREVVR